MHIAVRGAVQGVGFRPFLYRLASELGLAGWVTNSPAGVELEVEGAAEQVLSFRLRLDQEAPAPSRIQGMECITLDPAGHASFEIRESTSAGPKSALILPDIALCPACRAELHDPANRRHRYPFINCTHCGPRFSIVLSLPYDRPHTTMRDFVLCEACRREYEDPGDRRFHAQPNGCPDCGPRLAWWTPEGEEQAVGDHALRQAERTIREGRVVAVKGLGGFHLMVDARNPDAVQALRHRKHREEKPFACMAPSLDVVRELCRVTPLEEQILRSPEAPIVLLRKRRPDGVATGVAPSNPYLGLMLPYTPLHDLLMTDLGFPVVATSGNRSEEPICTDEREAIHRLAGLADGFLIHNRPIARHVDDSIVSVVAGQEQVLRRARGYAPFPIRSSRPVDGILAVGGHLKNAVALGVGHDLFVSQHIGDLETEAADRAFRSVIDDFQRLYEVRPTRIAHDLHPDYASTRYALAFGATAVPVQHHFAHIAAVMLENQVEPPLLGVSWDGTGYGLDGTVWGGEFVWVDEDAHFTRVGRLRPFPLPGGEAAVREPRRSALGLLFAWRGEEVLDEPDWLPVRAFSSNELRVLRRMLRRGVSTPTTTSMGRLFDGIASMIGLCQRSRHEGQAAMALEHRIEAEQPPAGYSCTWLDGAPYEMDWFQTLEGISRDWKSGRPAADIAARFHATLVDAVADLAGRLRASKVVLGGGCFQNRILTAWTLERLRADGLSAYHAQRIPPNDGGLAVGQAAIASQRPS
jgi:hydrogenase maturation protein HypF